MVISSEMRSYKIHFHCLPWTTFGLLNRLSTSLYQFRSCFRHGNWATNKRPAFLGPSLATSVPRLKIGSSGGANCELIGGFVGAPGGVESLGRNGDLLHRSLPGHTGFAVTPILQARDLGARGEVTALIENCRDRWGSLHVAGNLLIHGFVKTELQSKGTYLSSLRNDKAFKKMCVII